MKVEEVDAFPIRVKGKEELRGGTFSYPDFQTVLVRVVCDGAEGWGEAMSRSDPMVNALLVRFLGRGILGREHKDVGAVWQEVWKQLRVRGHTRGPPVEALSGLEIALQDSAAKLVGKSVAGMFGGGEPKVKAFAGSIFESRGPIEDQVELAKQSGLGGAKVKVGFGLAKDLDILKEVRRAWPDGTLVADANGAYDAAYAKKACEAFNPLDLSWFEEPVPSDDFEGYASLGGSKVRIGAGEAWFVSDFDRPVADRLVGVVEPSVSRCGGFGVEAAVSLAAKSRRIGFSPMTGMNSVISLAASLQVESLRPSEGVEFNPFHNPLQSDLASGVSEPKDGMMEVPRGPGLGLEVDMAFVKRNSLG